MLQSHKQPPTSVGWFLFLISAGWKLQTRKYLAIYFKRGKKHVNLLRLFTGIISLLNRTPSSPPSPHFNNVSVIVLPPNKCFEGLLIPILPSRKIRLRYSNLLLIDLFLLKKQGLIPCQHWVLKLDFMTGRGLCLCGYPSCLWQGCNEGEGKKEMVNLAVQWRDGGNLMGGRERKASPFHTDFLGWGHCYYFHLHSFGEARAWLLKLYRCQVLWTG